MSDDIVTRLREELLGFHNHLSTWEINAERHEAADEIERLKAEVEKWRKVADTFYSRHDRGRTCNLISPCHECDAYEKAVRDE